jgi:uncharacterized membrane protein YhaH (DUF805 family)
MGWLKKYFVLNGRLTALQYWRYQVRLAFAAVAVVSATALLTQVSGWLGAIPFAFILPLAVAGVSVGVRRLHDRGKGAWWLALFTLGPIALIAPGRLVAHGASTGLLLGAALLSLLAVALAIWAWIEIGFLRGQKGPNRYGPDPRAASSAA